jgi:DNA-binding GntR family transcriptional regulator
MYQKLQSRRTPMPPLETRSVADQAAEVLRDAILTGQLKPGELYSVERIADQLELGVSRTPVREALVQLSAAGIVVVEPQRGFRIIKRNVHDIEELFQERLVLEVFATFRAVLAIEKGMIDKAALIARLRRKLEQMGVLAKRREALGKQNSSDPELQDLDLEFVKLDMRFHERILKAAGNQRLANDVGHVRYSITALGASRLSLASGLLNVQREHELIFEAVEDGDPHAAARAMYDHLVSTGNAMSRLLEKEQQGSFDPGWMKGVVVPSRRRRGSGSTPRARTPRTAQPAR